MERNRNRTYRNWKPGEISESVMREKKANGVFGYKTNLGIYVKRFGPQKGRKIGRKRKNVCKMASTNEILHIEDARLEKLRFLRDKLKTLSFLEEITGKTIMQFRERKALSLITQTIWGRISPQEQQMMELRDSRKRSSLEGKIHNQGLGIVKTGGLVKEVKFILNNYYRIE